MNPQELDNLKDTIDMLTDALMMCVDEFEVLSEMVEHNTTTLQLISNIKVLLNNVKRGL